MTTPYATPALRSQNWFFFSSLQKPKWFSVQVFGAIYNECNKARAEVLVDISQQVQGTNCKHIKEQCLDLKSYRDCREVLLNLTEDAEAYRDKTDSEAVRITKEAKYCTLGPP